jgi:putative hydrolase of the HAD superfamily
MPIRAVLFDIDDTLFDYTGSDSRAALQHIEAERLLSRFPSPEAALVRWREVMEEQFARFLTGEFGFLEHRRERARTFLGTALTDAEADVWFGRYVTLYERAWTLFPDVLPALDALAPPPGLRPGGAPRRLGALSNSSVANQERKLRRLGIRDRLEVLLCADELGHAKPAPEAFHAGCEALGLPPGEVAYVGDRHDIDARAADEAGLHGVWLDRTDGAEPSARTVPAGAAGVRRIAGLDELPALLTRIP